MVREQKGVMLPHDLLGEKVRQLANCGRVTEERISLIWKRN